MLLLLFIVVPVVVVVIQPPWPMGCDCSGCRIGGPDTETTAEYYDDDDDDDDENYYDCVSCHTPVWHRIILDVLLLWLS